MALSLTPVATTSDSFAETGRRQRLLDVYGALLTEHQREALRLHLDEDWSFSELADQFGCTRSAAHDLVRRACTQLEHFEERLGHAAELARRDAVEVCLRAEAARLASAAARELPVPPPSYRAAAAQARSTVPAVPTGNV